MPKKLKNNKYAGEYTIKILDTTYNLFVDNDPTLLDEYNANGLTDDILKTIHIRNLFNEIKDKKLAELTLKPVLRHELIHAFLYECGLTTNTSEEVGWPVSESMADFFAIQWEKLDNLFKDSYEIISQLKEKSM